MNKIYSLRLSENDLGQLLDGLEVRAIAWEKTGDYLRTNKPPQDFIVEECGNPDEADALARRYRSIIVEIFKQRDAQV